MVSVSLLYSKQRTQHVVASVNQATEVTPSLARRLPFSNNNNSQQLNDTSDSFQVPEVQVDKRLR